MVLTLPESEEERILRMQERATSFNTWERARESLDSALNVLLVVWSRKSPVLASRGSCGGQRFR